MLPKLPTNKTKKLSSGTTTNNSEFCVIRTYSAGVYLGYVQERNGTEAIITDAQMLWSWSGAASLLQVAADGCDSEKLTVKVPKIYLTEIIAIIPISEKAKIKLSKINLWKL